MLDEWDLTIWQVIDGVWVSQICEYGWFDGLSQVPLTVTVQGNRILGYTPSSANRPDLWLAGSLPPGRVGIISWTSGMVFSEPKVERILWNNPATPTWQVYGGTISVDNGTATLTGRPYGPQCLAVREGRYQGSRDATDGYDIEATLGVMSPSQPTQAWSGLAVHVRDIGDSLEWHEANT